MSDRPIQRRADLAFASLDDAVAEARSLLAGGYARAGNWTLGQTCDHLATFTRYSLDGFPSRGLPWPLTAIARWAFLREAKLSKPMPANLPTPSFLRSDEADDGAGVERFANECGRFQQRLADGGSLARSPIFGRLTPQTWGRMHRNHAALHLGFLVPAGGE